MSPTILHWVGANVVAAGAILTAGRDVISGHVKMYARNPLQQGSSVVHFDTSLTPDQIMEPFIVTSTHDVGLADDRNPGHHQRRGDGAVD